MTPTERERQARKVVNRFILGTRNSHYTVIEGDDADVLVELIVQYGSEIEAAVLKEAQRIVDSEEELPGDMPDEMFQAITSGDRAIAAETLRAVVRATKKSLMSRLREQPS